MGSGSLGSRARDAYVTLDPLSALEHDDWRLRRLAAVALAKRTRERAATVLLELVRRGQGVDEELIGALASTRDDRTVPVLIELLSHESSAVCQATVAVLGDLGDRRAVPPLIKALTANDEDVPPRAARALGVIGDPRAVPALIKALKIDDTHLSMAAAQSLGDIGDPRAVPHLIATISSRNTSVSYQAMRALAKIDDERVVPALLTLIREAKELVTDENESLRGNAVDALSEIEGQRGVTALMRALGVTGAPAEAASPSPAPDAQGTLEEQRLLEFWRTLSEDAAMRLARGIPREDPTEHHR